MKDGEVVCNKCHGTGQVISSYEYFPEKICPKCLSIGKLDWIENIVGKKQDSLLSYTFTSTPPVDFI